MKNNRLDFPSAVNQTYLNTPANGLLSQKTTKSIIDFHKNYLEQGSVFAETWLNNEMPQVRQAVADFIDADVDRIALIPNFSFGYNSLLDSIGPKRTLVYSRDYPSLKIPLELKKFELIEIDDKSGFEISQETLFDSLLKNNIELLVLSHAQFRTGFVIDLKAIGDFCKEHDILFIVDATQTTGAIEISVTELNIDALIWSNYKWMNAGFASGVMYLNPEMIDRFPPKIGGYGSFFFEGDDWIYRPSSRSYEPSHPNMSALAGLKSAIGEKVAIGTKALIEYNRELLQYLISQMDQADVPYYGRNVQGKRAFVVFPSEQTLFENLRKEKIVTTFREGYIRLGVHFYNSKEDVDHLMSVLSSH